MAPGRHDYVFLHARLLARASSFAAARNVLAPLMSGAYPPEVRDNARTLMGYIVQVERAASSRSAAAAAPAPDTTAPSPDSSSAAPTVPSPDAERFQPLYRVVESGEVRVEGVLQRIDCNGESVVMTLHTSEGQSTFSAAGLDKVDFITYRNDLTGAITCGPLKDPARVYLTWKMSAGRQAVVAIEFLPR
jgi:hypothetical protein